MNVEEEVNGEPKTVEDAAGADGLVENLSHIPISISIELSRTQLSLKELSALKNGDVLELNKPPNEQIDLLVSGKVIGSGELVDIDGELGVRICSLVK